jgi:hypothetical protein
VPELKVCLTVGYVAEAEDVTFLYASFSKAYRTGLIPKTVLLDMASRSGIGASGLRRAGRPLAWLRIGCGRQARSTKPVRTHHIRKFNLVPMTF